MPRSSDELQLFEGKGCRKGQSVHQVVLAVIGPLCRLLIFLVAFAVLEVHMLHPPYFLPSFWSSSKKHVEHRRYLLVAVQVFCLPVQCFTLASGQRTSKMSTSLPVPNSGTHTLKILWTSKCSDIATWKFCWHLCPSVTICPSSQEEPLFLSPQSQILWAIWYNYVYWSLPELYSPLLLYKISFRSSVCLNSVSPHLDGGPSRDEIMSFLSSFPCLFVWPHNALWNRVIALQRKNHMFLQ